MNCAYCSRPITPRVGRGKEATRCPDCNQDHKRAATQRRFARMSVTLMAEVIAIEPFLSRQRREIEAIQEGRCKSCNELSRLFLVFDETGWYGLCGTCHAEREQGGHDAE